MNIRYLGTAAAEGFPAAFCNCEYCTKARADLQTEWRTRSQAIIDGQLLIDFPPESYMHAVRFGIDLSAIRILLVTHSHTDHFYAQEFVNRGYKFAYKMAAAQLNIYGNEEVLKVFREGTARELKECVSEGLNFHCIQPFTAFETQGYEIFALPATHMRAEKALLYGIRKGDKALLYLNDTALLSESCYSYLADKGFCADFVSFDCTLADGEHKNSLRHMGFDENEGVREKLLKYRIAKSGTKYCVTHFSHNAAPFRSRIEREAEKRGFYAAYDGAMFVF